MQYTLPSKKPLKSPIYSSYNEWRLYYLYIKYTQRNSELHSNYIYQAMCLMQVKIFIYQPKDLPGYPKSQQLYNDPKHLIY